MANPVKPVLTYSYTGYQEEQQGVSNFPGTNMDNDLAELVTSIDQTIDALADVRRSDGQLKNGVVTTDSLAVDVGETIYTFVSGIRTYTGVADTLLLTDAGKIVESNCADLNTCTVPPFSSVAFEVLTRIDLVMLGAGAIRVTPGAGVTIHSRDGYLGITDRYGAASLYNRGQDEWVLIGALSP